MNPDSLRRGLVELLGGESAHISPRNALDAVDPNLRAVRPFSGGHSIWDQLEHMRLAQEDILQYTLDPEWRSPEWPAGYWPARVEHVSDEEWEASVARFFEDLNRVVILVSDPTTDLTAQIPHGEGRTYLRQVLLVADHNAYHTGQIVQIRKALGAWS